MSISRLPHLEHRTQLVPIGHHHFGAVALRLFGRVGFYLVATIAARRWTMRAIEAGLLGRMPKDLPNERPRFPRRHSDLTNIPDS